jgi:hypothetical protein
MDSTSRFRERCDAAKAVNCGDDNHVVMREDGYQLFKLWPVGGRAGDLLAENRLATGCLELGG